jgi:hypothetical protein
MKTPGRFGKDIYKLSLMLLGAGAALAQNPPAPPTGIQMTGAVSITRAEGLVPAFLPGSAPTPSLTEIFGAAFVTTDYTNYTPPPPPDPSTIQTVGPCIVLTLSSITPTPANIVITPLDAGPAINLNGPNGLKTFPVTKGSYGGMLGGGIPLPIPGAPPPAPPFIVPGAYTVDNGAGGADIGPFTTSLTLSDPLFEWTNPDANLTVNRSAGVDITFSGGDPDSPVIIQGTVSIIDPTTFKLTGGAAFTCTVPNTGEFLVTSDVLNLLPATVPLPTSPIPSSTLTVSQGVRANFDAPIATTSTFSFQTGVSRSVTYQ